MLVFFSERMLIACLFSLFLYPKCKRANIIGRNAPLFHWASVMMKKNSFLLNSGLRLKVKMQFLKEFRLN